MCLAMGALRSRREDGRCDIGLLQWSRMSLTLIRADRARVMAGPGHRAADIDDDWNDAMVDYRGEARRIINAVL